MVVHVTQLVIMMRWHYGILLSLCRCQLRHINHVSINIATSIIGGRRWHGIWQIRWISTGYWRSLQLMCCVMWISGWLLTNRVHLSCINDLIIQCRRHKYHWLWQIISIWVTVIYIKAPVITGSVMWISGWLLTNRGQLRWIDDWIIRYRRNRYHCLWQLVALWVTAVASKASVITITCSLPTLIVPCSTFVATTNTLESWHDEYNMSLWWNYVLVILFVDWPSKGGVQLFGATTAVMFEFVYQE